MRNVVPPVEEMKKIVKLNQDIPRVRNKSPDVTQRSSSIKRALPEQRPDRPLESIRKRT